MSMGADVSLLPVTATRGYSPDDYIKCEEAALHNADPSDMRKLEAVWKDRIAAAVASGDLMDMDLAGRMRTDPQATDSACCAPLGLDANGKPKVWPCIGTSGGGAASTSDKTGLYVALGLLAVGLIVAVSL